MVQQIFRTSTSILLYRELNVYSLCRVMYSSSVSSDLEMKKKATNNKTILPTNWRSTPHPHSISTFRVRGEDHASKPRIWRTWTGQQLRPKDELYYWVQVLSIALCQCALQFALNTSCNCTLLVPSWIMLSRVLPSKSSDVLMFVSIMKHLFLMPPNPIDEFLHLSLTSLLQNNGYIFLAFYFGRGSPLRHTHI